MIKIEWDGGSDTHSIRIYNLQPTDLLSIDDSNINISLGKQNQSSFTEPQINFRNNNFTKYDANPAISIMDIDYSNNINQDRSVSSFYNNEFSFGIGSPSMIYLEFISNNEDSLDSHRVIFDSNTFYDNEFSCCVVEFHGDRTTDNYNITSISFNHSAFSNNTCEYIVKPVMDGTIVSVDMNDIEFYKLNDLSKGVIILD